MKVNRGDVVLARFPHDAGTRGKKRPVVVVQSDVYNPELRHVIVAEVTTNVAAASDAANLLVEVSTPEGKATGLRQDSLVTCLHLVTMNEDRIGKMIGKLSASLLQKLNDCLKAALQLP